MKNLTKRQEMFVCYLLHHGNGARAAREAGYSENTAAKIAWELLNSAKYRHVQAEYRKKLANTKAMAELARQAIHESCMVDLRMDKLKARDPSELDEAERAAISGFTFTKHKSGSGKDAQESETISVKFGSKAEARKMLYKLHGMDREDGSDSGDAEWESAASAFESAMAEVEADYQEAISEPADGGAEEIS